MCDVVEAHSSLGESPEEEERVYALGVEDVEFCLAVAAVVDQDGVVESDLVVSDDPSVVVEEVVTVSLCVEVVDISVLEFF